MKMSSNRETAFPNEWADDQVMDVLFSPFRGSRDVNPRSWDSKMKFWTDMIRNYCVDKKALIIHARNIPQVFERNGKIPSCLNVVIDDLKRHGVIQSLSDYHASTETSWLSWSVNLFVKKPVQWSYNNVVKSSISWASGMIFGRQTNDNYRPRSRIDLLHDLPNEQFVLLDLVKSAADAVYQRHRESVMYEVTDNLISYTALRNSCRDICSDDESFHVAILELVKQKLCTVVSSTDGDQLIRMVINKKDMASPLSENEEKIYRLKVTAKKLEENIEKTTEEMEECRKTAKSLLQQNKKSAALKCLKRKKMLSESISQKETAVDKLYQLINSIQQTESQKQIIDAFSSGVAAFKTITKEHRLTADKIDDTMLDVQEAFQDNEQINTALAQPIGGPTDISDAELENELEEILNSKQEVVHPELLDLDLPDVPKHSLTVTPSKSWISMPTYE